MVVKVLLVLCDQPERSNMTFIQAHNAIDEKRWGYYAYIKQNKFPSCFGFLYLQCPDRTFCVCGVTITLRNELNHPKPHRLKSAKHTTNEMYIVETKLLVRFLFGPHALC